MADSLIYGQDVNRLDKGSIPRKQYVTTKLL